MTTYYVGPGGNDANDGLSWSARKLTLNGAEDVPVAAGDTVYVAPGVYRELLTVDVSGEAGAIITYIGDVTGEHTDGVGGIVRITGSDNDLAAARNNCILISSKNYRTFRGFTMDTVAQYPFVMASCTYIIVEFCSIYGNLKGITSTGAGQSNITIRNCMLMGSSSYAIELSHSADTSNCAELVENCLIVATIKGIFTTNLGGVTIKNNTFVGCNIGVEQYSAPAAGQTIVIYNNIFYCCTNRAIEVSTAGFTSEDYNTFYTCANAIGADCASGGHSLTAPPLFEAPMLSDGVIYPWNPFALSKWSTIKGIAGTGEPADDMFGVTRTTVAAKKSWGAVQYAPGIRSTTQAHLGSVSIKLPDAGAHQIFVPHDGAPVSVSVYAYMEADHAGTQPQMIIKQPGSADSTTTSTGDAATWALLSAAFTPAAKPDYFVIELRSLNTAVAGDYGVYFDDLKVE